MDETSERPRKRLDEEPGGARRNAARRGRLKDGRLLSAALKERTGRPKPGVEASLALYGEKTRRRDWGPQVAARIEPSPEARSVRLRLEVERGEIRVLDSTVVDVAPPEQGTVRGTAFIEVRAGKAVVALQAVVDPGLSIGIPDRTDPDDAFRGHRVVEEETWEAAVLVPLEAVADRDAELSVSIYRASERLILETASESPLARRSRRVEELAASKPMRAADLPHLRTDRDGRKPEPRASAD
ncbi:hypothetical protein [Agromyces sp. S2-1-8]|uniref:hypothetical protein n=1 Tax=unclassified Agromyces TaxID=2639701 RepID=UPI001E5F0E49|nr:hypothetical protein [Agromyces sp. S2-1-8]MCD5345628.1 hypothetical protein [Agromyces sp. S2-1-8]